MEHLYKKSIVKGKMFVLILTSFPQQISMSATTTMVAVHKPAPTQMVHFGAAVDLGLDWTVMEELAVVSVYHTTVLYHEQ